VLGLVRLFSVGGELSLHSCSCSCSSSTRPRPRRRSVMWSRKCGHVLPGIRQRINPSRRERCDSVAVAIAKLEPSCELPSRLVARDESGSSSVYRQNTSRGLESYRALRDGSFLHIIPGNKLPGYDHSVSPGQLPTSPFGPTNRHYFPHLRPHITEHLRGRGGGRLRAHPIGPHKAFLI
jgi:hypothetical protein